MRIGITTPVVTAYPGTTSSWERDAGPAELVQIAEAADHLGYDHLTCSEHVAVPADVAQVRGGTYWDPLATLAYLAAHTTSIRLVTSVLVLGYHHPLAIAKRYGTLDALAGGRVVLGLGVGSLEEEFTMLGAPFADRGARADDALRALRAALSETVPSYEGEFYSFTGMVVSPSTVQDQLPLWIGGRTRRSLRRAVAFGQGWMPFGLTPGEVTELLTSVDLPTDLDVVLPTTPLDPSAAPDQALAEVSALAGAGATRLSVSVAAESARHYVEQLHALRELLAGSSPDPLGTFRQ